MTVSLVLPTLDESETIGPIVRRAIREMQERYPLLDEVLVIDSASTDDTVAIAEGEGARVIQHADVLQRYGSFRGKSEALWKSLSETCGDIVVWADTDVRNWHARMVHGTLGPCSSSPGSSTSRATTSGRSSRQACSRKAAAAGSPSSSRGRS